MPCIHKKMKKILLGISLLFVGCQTEKLHFIEGEAQGSTYHIKYISSNNENLQPAIDSILKVIDESMSTYKPDILEKFLRLHNKYGRKVKVCLTLL